MATAKPPKPGEGKDIVVTLSPQLNLDLWAFGEALSGAAHRRIICEALDNYIQGRLSAEPLLRQRFNEAKAKAYRPPAEVRRLDEGRLLEARRSDSHEP